MDNNNAEVARTSPLTATMQKLAVAQRWVDMDTNAEAEQTPPPTAIMQKLAVAQRWAAMDDSDAEAEQMSGSPIPQPTAQILAVAQKWANMESEPEDGNTDLNPAPESSDDELPARLNALAVNWVSRFTDDGADDGAEADRQNDHSDPGEGDRKLALAKRWVDMGSDTEDINKSSDEDTPVKLDVLIDFLLGHYVDAPAGAGASANEGNNSGVKEDEDEDEDQDDADAEEEEEEAEDDQQDAENDNDGAGASADVTMSNALPGFIASPSKISLTPGPYTACDFDLMPLQWFTESDLDMEQSEMSNKE